MYTHVGPANVESNVEKKTAMYECDVSKDKEEDNDSVEEKVVQDPRA